MVNPGDGGVARVAEVVPSQTGAAAAVRHIAGVFGIACIAVIVAAVSCAMLTPGSLEHQSSIGPVPVNAQDEMRVTGEVWFAMVMTTLAIGTTILWWRRGQWRGPIGMIVATAAAIGQTAIAGLVWRAVVALRGFGAVPAEGAEYLRAPVLTSTSSWWLAAVAAVLTYAVLTILASHSDLRRE